MSTQEYIRSTIPDEFPTLTPISETNVSSSSSFFTNISWQTWLIIVLILALLGFNIFVYLAKGTQVTASIFEQIFGPILKLFGYSTLETTRQTVTTSATGTKAGVDVAANTVTGVINTVEQTALASQQTALASQNNGLPVSTSGTSVGISTTNDSTNVQGQMATSSLPVQKPAGTNVDQWRTEQRDSLEKALSSASQSANSNTNDPSPDDSRSIIQSSGKSGWCFIGEDQGIRTCSEIGVNDACMSGNVFPNQAICMNPNLRA